MISGVSAPGWFFFSIITSKNGRDHLAQPPVKCGCTGGLRRIFSFHDHLPQQKGRKPTTQAVSPTRVAGRCSPAGGRKATTRLYPAQKSNLLDCPNLALWAAARRALWGGKKGPQQVSKPPARTIGPQRPNTAFHPLGGTGTLPEPKKGHKRPQTGQRGGHGSRAAPQVRSGPFAAGHMVCSTGPVSGPSGSAVSCPAR